PPGASWALAAIGAINGDAGGICDGGGNDGDGDGVMGAIDGRPSPGAACGNRSPRSPRIRSYSPSTLSSIIRRVSLFSGCATSLNSPFFFFRLGMLMNRPSL